MDKCRNCSQVFKRKIKGYKRRSCALLMPDMDGYFCDPCYSNIKSQKKVDKCPNTSDIIPSKVDHKVITTSDMIPSPKQDPKVFTTDDKNDSDEIYAWDQFLNQMSIMLTIGYSLTEPIQWIAITNLQDSVDGWREIIAKNNKTLIDSHTKLDDNFPGHDNNKTYTNDVQVDEINCALEIKQKHEEINPINCVGSRLKNDTAIDKDVVPEKESEEAETRIGNDDDTAIEKDIAHDKDSKEEETMRKSHTRSNKFLKYYSDDSDSDIEDDLLKVKDEVISPIKRRRGRPRKSTFINTVSKSEGDSEYSIGEELMETQEKSSRIKRKCYSCDVAFNNKHDYRDHIRDHNEKFKCPVVNCENEVKTMAGIKAHIESHFPSLLCPNCDLMLPNKSTLNRHIASKHDKSLRRFECFICLKRFTKSCVLKEHIKIHGNRIRNQMCPHCDHSTYSEKLLETHIQQKHMDGDKFVCSICGFETRYKACLIEHQLRHTKDKTYKCDKCPFAGKTINDLRKHVKIHQPHKFQCNLCGKTFVQNMHLQRHLVVHSGVKDFPCQYCSYKCNLLDNLRKHIRNIHHRELPRASNNRIIHVEMSSTDNANSVVEELTYQVENEDNSMEPKSQLEVANKGDSTVQLAGDISPRNIIPCYLHPI